MKCPSCDAPIGMTMLADSDSTLKIELTPDSDSLLQAKTLGGILVNSDDLFREVGKSDGVKINTLIHSLDMQDDGKITVGLTLVKTVMKAIPDHDEHERKTRMRKQHDHSQTIC